MTPFSVVYCSNPEKKLRDEAAFPRFGRNRWRGLVLEVDSVIGAYEQDWIWPELATYGSWKQDGGGLPPSVWLTFLAPAHHPARRCERHSPHSDATAAEQALSDALTN